MKTSAKSKFDNEAQLCRVFISHLPEGWTAYPETEGFDILLVRAVDGAQVGVEAKMTLNAKVLLQAIENIYHNEHWSGGNPDFRAVLVPDGAAGGEMKQIARVLGVSVLECRSAADREAAVQARIEDWGRYGHVVSEDLAARIRKEVELDWKPFSPDLPGIDDWRERWVDFCPAERCPVPDYIPDVAAGASAPTQLSRWKVKAIKICILLSKRGEVTISDFKAIEIDRKRWLDMGWMAAKPGCRGVYIAGHRTPDFRVQHPVNYGEIEADFDKWAPAASMVGVTEALL